MEKIPVLAVVGPTASGKTAFALRLAQAVGGEIVSADSMQIYRGMDIATAKPTGDETGLVPHHLIDYVLPEETYSVKRFVEDASNAIDGITAKGKVPVVCGGTGLYVDSLLGNMAFEEEPDDPGVRSALKNELARRGLEALVYELQSVDPALAAEMDLKNEKRVLRALEIYRLTGEKPSLRRERARSADSRYDALYFVLCFFDREKLYARIDARVDRMLELGLVEEAKAFYASPASATATAAIGYKELKPYLDGEISLDAAADALRRATRRYAKRQITWFKRNTNAVPLYRDRFDDEALLSQALSAVKDRFGDGFGRRESHE